MVLYNMMDGSYERIENSNSIKMVGIMCHGMIPKSFFISDFAERAPAAKMFDSCIPVLMLEKKTDFMSWNVRIY